MVIAGKVEVKTQERRLDMSCGGCGSSVAHDGQRGGELLTVNDTISDEKRA